MAVDVYQSSRASLAMLLALGDQGPADWGPQDYAGILRHQLAVPLLPVAAGIDGGTRGVRGRTGSDDGSPRVSLADLLSEDHPSATLLEWAKQACRHWIEQGASPVPREMAYVLYYTVIVAALTRAGTRITRLTDAQLRTGIESSLACPWLAPLCRAVLEEGRARLGPAAPPAPAPAPDAA